MSHLVLERDSRDRSREVPATPGKGGICLRMHGECWQSRLGSMVHTLHHCQVRGLTTKGPASASMASIGLGQRHRRLVVVLPPCG